MKSSRFCEGPTAILRALAPSLGLSHRAPAADEPVSRRMSHEHYFICPHCGNRSMGIDRNAGFRREARGCEKCGFAYLYELLDDYYPAPNAAFFACDSAGRVIDCGRGSFELTGLRTESAIGQSLQDALSLSFAD